MTIEAKLLTGEDLWAISHDPAHEGHGHELLDGVLVEMAPNGGEHDFIRNLAAYRFTSHVLAHDLGYIMSGDTGYFFSRRPDRVRAPDISFIARDRIPDGRLPRGYFDIIPDLVVEVVSPNDTAAEVEQKVMEWLALGVRLVLVAFPTTRSVLAYRGPADVRRFTDTDILDAEPVLPGFACPVARLFRNEQ